MTSVGCRREGKVPGLLIGEVSSASCLWHRQTPNVFWCTKRLIVVWVCGGAVTVLCHISISRTWEHESAAGSSVRWFHRPLAQCHLLQSVSLDPWWVTNPLFQSTGRCVIRDWSLQRMWQKPKTSMQAWRTDISQFSPSAAHTHTQRQNLRKTDLEAEARKYACILCSCFFSALATVIRD